MTSYPHSRPATVTPPWRSLAAPGSVPAFIVRRIVIGIVLLVALIMAVFVLFFGITSVSFGPTSAVVALKNRIGSFGNAAPVSFA